MAGLLPGRFLWQRWTTVLAFMYALTDLGISRFTTDRLFVSNGTNILLITSEGNVEPIISQNVHRAVGVAVDMWHGDLFWTDIGAGRQGIYRAGLDGSNPRRIMQDVGRVNGLSVNWVSRHIYWTDEERQTIEMSDYSGDFRKIILDKDMKWPRGIVVDPIDGLMYWGDQGTQQIERARLDGSNRELLVYTGLIWPNQLAISYATRRLYWVDAYNKTIESCELLGDDRRREHDLLESPYSAPIFGLAVRDHTAYISTWYDGAVFSVLLDHSADDFDRLRPEVELLTQREMFSIAVGDRSAQPPGSSACGGSDQGGCSHICLMTSGDSYRCACPTYGSMVLSADGKTCVEPEEMLLYADKDKAQIGMLPLNGASTADRYVLATSVMPVAVSYDPIDQVIYWSDVKERVIYRAAFNGSLKEVFLAEEEGIGTVDGLHVDWRNRRLYFCNMGASSPKADGAAFTWHRIEFIGLDRRQRRVVVTDVDKPRAVQIDAENGYMYYSDWGANPRVVRRDLDGNNPKEILAPGNVSNPNGLAIYGHWLYVVDSNYNKRVHTAYLAAYDTLAERWLRLQSSQVFIPFGLAAREGQLFYTDWVSTETTTGTIFAYDIQTHEATVLVSEMSNPTGLFYSRSRVGLVETQCKNSDCSDICVPTTSSDGTKYRCLCSEGSGKVLANDGKTCNEPDSFLIFSDLNTIKMVAVNMSSGSVTSDRHVYTLYYGYYSANYVAVTYDAQNREIYWSDLYRKEILVGNLSGHPRRVFHAGEHAVDGLALDNAGRHLYWTGYTDYIGVIAMASITPDGATYSELLTGLDQPRAIVLDPQRRYMYWTEYGRRAGGKPRVCRAFLDGSNQETIADTDLSWPNALSISENKLFLADGSHRRIEVLELDGSQRGVLNQVSGDMEHIFGMVVKGGRLLFYTDWNANRTVGVDLHTGESRTLAAKLYRPGALLVYGPPSLQTDAGNVCMPGNHDCHDICVPVPEGYHCACLLGQKLAEDRRTCIDATTWLATDWFRCGEECHPNAHCAQLMPTSVFRCVCREGFHGDGVNHCQGCRENEYKTELGNGSCQPCPRGSGTLGWTASITCSCDDANFDFIHGHCVLHMKDENGTATDLPPIGYGVRPPVFLNCPEGEVLQYTLPENASFITLNVSLSARSWKGQEVTISGSHRPPPGTLFPWKGPGPAGYQHLTYLATDAWGMSSSCNFTLQVIDDQPPRFDHCPPDVVLHTGAPLTTKGAQSVATVVVVARQRVFWKEPRAMDNVGVIELHRPTVVSGSTFDVGRHTLAYCAEDGAGNKAWCNFTITVKKTEIKCDSLGGEPQNGGIQCREGPSDRGAYECRTFCDPFNYDLNPDPSYHVVRCDQSGYWLNSFPKDYANKACLRKTSVRVVLRKLQFWLQGPCDPTRRGLQSTIADAILRLMEEDGLCSWKYGPDDVRDTCREEEVEVTCGRTKRRSRRSGSAVGRRNFDGLDEVNEQTLEHERTPRADVLVMWTVMETASSDGNVSVAEEKVTSRASRLQARFDLGVTFTAGGATYRSLQEAAIVAPLVMTCGHGSFNISDMCLLCPVGTYQSRETSWCVDCPSGHYQDLEGQESCKQCPDGTRSHAGAYNVSQCAVVDLTPAVLHVHRNAIIVAVGSLILALLTVLLVLLCCRYYRGHRRFSGKMCDRERSGRANPYVIEIHAGHQGDIAYEEILDQEKQPPASQAGQEHLLQQKTTSTPASKSPALGSGGDRGTPLKVSHKGAIVRHNRAPSEVSGEKREPLIGAMCDNREEICLEVQSVLQAGSKSEIAVSSRGEGGGDNELEDTPVHSSTALLKHSKEGSPDNE